MIQNIIPKREAQRVWLRLCEWTEWRSVSRASRFESMHLVWFRYVWRVLYMLNGFLTSHFLWNGQSAQIALAECALKALEYILPTENERNGERVRKRGRKNEGCVWERENQRKKRKQNSVYGSGCLWNNFPYQWNCMSPVGKGIWFSPYSANGKEELESKQERRKPGRERERHLLAFTSVIP